MNLNDLLKEFKPIRLAKEGDSQSLQKFFSQSPMDSQQLSLSYQREPDFFTFLTYQASESFIFCAHNEQDELLAVGTLSIREGYVNGEIKRIGYLGDLRVSNNKKNIKFAYLWKRFMAKLVKNIQNIEPINCDYLITAIMGDNKKAKNSLVNRKQNDFHYEKLASFKMINLVTCWRKQHRIKDVQIIRANDRDREELLNFCEKAGKARQFGYSRKFIENALKNWHNFSIDNFLLAIKDNEIIGACATWNPSPVKKIIINKFPLYLKLLNCFSSFFTYVPKEKKELKVQYLNFLILPEENKNILGNMINFLKNEKIFKKYHLLAFADFDHCPIANDLKYCIYDKTPIDLYQVVNKDNRADIIKLENIPGFEISLV